MKNKIKVYQVTEDDWVAAKDSRAARRYFKNQVGACPGLVLKRVCALSSKAMKEHKILSEDSRAIRSFEAELRRLIKNKESFPTMFASNL